MSPLAMNSATGKRLLALEMFDAPPPPETAL